jgi:nitroreductase
MVPLSSGDAEIQPNSDHVVVLLARIGCVSEFDGRPIADDVAAAIVAAASCAPSAGNAQPWEIVAIRSPEQKARVGAALLDSLLRPQAGGAGRRSWVSDAPLLLVVCLDQTRAKARIGDIGKDLFGIQDTGAALQNMRLTALTYGVKSCLVREFDAERVAEVLELPRHVRPLILLALGYSEHEPKPLPRLPLTDYLHHERW